MQFVERTTTQLENNGCIARMHSHAVLTSFFEMSRFSATFSLDSELNAVRNRCVKDNTNYFKVEWSEQDKMAVMFSKLKCNLLLLTKRY